MEKITERIQLVFATHFKNVECIIGTDNSINSPYMLRMNKKYEVNSITVYPKFIKNVIKNNFTIFERIFYGNKLKDAAVMVIMSTIYNLVKSKECLEMMMDLKKKDIKTEFDYSKYKGEFELFSKKLIQEIIPYKDRNKYIVQPDIVINTNSNLVNVFSNILFESIMDFVGFTPDEESRRRIKNWELK